MGSGHPSKAERVASVCEGSGVVTTGFELTVREEGETYKVTVSEACYERIDNGDAWPSKSRVCE